MTREELEKKAEESFNNKLQKDVCYCTYNEEKIYKDGYIAGAKENGVVWHDLRKNPNDLPQKVGDYIVALDYQKGTFSTYLLQYNVDEDEDDIKFGWFDSEYTNYNDDVIAWCELPKFEVEE